jgi:FkbM family methyltransferase
MDALFRSLPVFKGKNRLAGFLLKKKLQTCKDILVEGKYGCRYLLPNLIENVSRDIFVNGIYEQDSSDFLAGRSPQQGIFLDLGANIGAISIPLYKKRKDLRIFGVEAAPWLFPYLQRNFEQNGLSKTSLVNKALFNSDDQDIDFFTPDVKFGKGSLSPTYTDKATTVRTVKLDTLIGQWQLPRVDIIKIDVEGHEYHVFGGAEILLGRSDAPDILFEFEDWAEDAAKLKPGTAQNFLITKGYSLYKLGDGARLYPMSEPFTKGSTMLLATKRGQ